MKKITAVSIFIIALLSTSLWGMYTLLPSEDAEISESAKNAVAEQSSRVWSPDDLYAIAHATATQPPVPTLAPEHEGLSDLDSVVREYIATRTGDWGLYVKRLDTNEYLLMNEREYSSASLIKLFTMAAVYNEIEAGTMTADDVLNHDLERMICESDNAACNRLTRRLGGGDAVKGMSVENAHTSSMGCTNTNHGSEIVDGSGRKVTFTGYNRTSPRDCGIVLEKIYRGQLVSQASSAKMLDLLINQTRTWKIPAGLPDGTVTANKTGETDTTEADAAIVYSPSCNYVICVIGNGKVGSGVETIKHISAEVYNYFNIVEHTGEDSDENITEGI